MYVRSYLQGSENGRVVTIGIEPTVDGIWGKNVNDRRGYKQ
jgi:hypothetical protein